MGEWVAVPFVSLVFYFFSSNVFTLLFDGTSGYFFQFEGTNFFPLLAFFCYSLLGCGVP